jgi:hypothetical protein
MAHELIVITLRGDDSYFEGHSGKLDALEGGGDFFMFEAPLAEGCYYLTRLGFTVGQIEEAIRNEEELMARQAEIQYEARLTDWSEGRLP